MGKRSESRLLTTKAEVMLALGGIAGLSDLTRSSYKATQNWTRSETFPARFHALMTWALGQKRLHARPSLWGQVTVPEMEKLAA